MATGCFIYELKWRSYRKLTDDIYDDLSIVKEQVLNLRNIILQGHYLFPLFTVVPG